MKKIMFYSKHRIASSTGLANGLKNNSSIIVLFVSFVCGTLTGSTLSVNTVSMDKLLFLFSPIAEADVKQYLIWGLFFTLLIWIISILGGLSCFGTIVQILILYLCGIYCSMVVCYFIIAYSFQGLAKVSVAILPGTSVIICALMLLGNLSNKISSLIASIVMYQGGEKIELKEYLIKAFFYFAAMITGILINCALMAVFFRI